MKSFRIALQRATVQEATVEVFAADESQAIDLAVQRAADGMVAWTEVHADTDAFAESEMKEAASG